MWPDKVIRQFKNVPSNPSENDYSGPYNKLLYTLFPADSDFLVVPQSLPDPQNLAEFTSMFEIHLVDKPVLILDLKPPSYLNVSSKRKAADYRIRARMFDVVETCPLETLYGVSALGTKLCFYSLDTKDDSEVVREVILCHPTRRTDTAPADRWNCDILEPAGEQRLRQIAQKIMDGCGALNG